MSKELKVIAGNEKFVEVKNAVREQEIVASIQMQIEFAQKVLFTAAYNIGKMLIESKEVIKHGEWENWVEARLPFKLRAAENYMKIYKEYKGNEIDDSSVYPSLGYSQALALIAVPSDEREEFAKQVNAKDLTIKELKATIKNMQEEQNSKDKELAQLQNTHEKLSEEYDALTKDFNKLTEHIDQLQEEKKIAEERQDEELAKRLEASIVKKKSSPLKRTSLHLMNKSNPCRKNRPKPSPKSEKKKSRSVNRKSTRKIRSLNLPPKNSIPKSRN